MKEPSSVFQPLLARPSTTQLAVDGALHVTSSWSTPPTIFAAFLGSGSQTPLLRAEALGAGLDREVTAAGNHGRPGGAPLCLSLHVVGAVGDARPVVLHPALLGGLVERVLLGLPLRVDLAALERGEQLDHEVHVGGEELRVGHAGLGEDLVEQGLLFVVVLDLDGEASPEARDVEVAVPLQAVHALLEVRAARLADLHESRHDRRHDVDDPPGHVPLLTLVFHRPRLSHLAALRHRVGVVEPLPAIQMRGRRKRSGGARGAETARVGD